MLATLIVMTLLVGFFAGVIALAGVICLIVRKEDKQRAIKRSDRHEQEVIDYVGTQMPATVLRTE